MKVMICQPMQGRTDEEIKKERDFIVENVLASGMELIDTFFQEEERDNPIYLLGKSIQAMSEADLVIFAKGWENARGCKIEFEIAKNYGKQMIIIGGNEI